MDAYFEVINPHHLLEDYLYLPPSAGQQTPQIDMIFYERIFNGEIVAGSYLAKYEGGEGRKLRIPSLAHLIIHFII
jgi:hypothetical protein